MRCFFLMIFLLSFPAICFSQPSIKFDSEKYDFGEVLDSMIEHTFEFTNTGTEDLKIEDIVPS